MSSSGPRSLRVAPIEDGLALSGDVDVATWDTLAEALERASEGPGERARVVVDVSEVSFIDGHGAGLIARAAHRLAPDRTLVVRGAPPEMLRVADLLRLMDQPGLLIEAPRDDGDR